MLLTQGVSTARGVQEKPPLVPKVPRENFHQKIGSTKKTERGAGGLNLIPNPSLQFRFWSLPAVKKNSVNYDAYSPNSVTLKIFILLKIFWNKSRSIAYVLGNGEPSQRNV